MTAAQNDVKFRALATRLLTKFGTTGTFVATTGGTYDPTTGSVTSASETSYTDVLMSPPLPAAEVYAAQDVRLKGDFVTFLAAPDLSFTPSAGMGLTHAGHEWSVMEVREFRSGNLPAAYALGLERG